MLQSACFKDFFTFFFHNHFFHNFYPITTCNKSGCNHWAVGCLIGDKKCNHSAVGCLIEDKKSKLKKGHNSEKMHFELSSLIVWITLWIVNTYSEFQVNIFSNNRDITKCQSFCTMTLTAPRLW